MKKQLILGDQVQSQFSGRCENERFSSQVSLIRKEILPAIKESQLVGEGQTAEEAFNEHFEDHSSMEDHHESLQRMLQAQSKVKRINEARKDEELPADKDAARQKAAR